MKTLKVLILFLKLKIRRKGKQYMKDDWNGKLKIKLGEKKSNIWRMIEMEGEGTLRCYEEDDCSVEDFLQVLEEGW